MTNDQGIFKDQAPTTKIRSPKLEIRRRSEIRIGSVDVPMPNPIGFGLRVSDFLRISGFGFPHLNLWDLELGHSLGLGHWSLVISIANLRRSLITGNVAG